VACNKPSDFFPIHWSELSTSLKATLRVSDLSFGSLSELLTSLKATLRVSDLSFGSLSELLTSLKATLRVSDLSFGSLSEHFALQNVTCLASHRIYLSDSLSEQINCVNLWLVNKPSDLSFRFIKIKKNRPQKLI